MAQVFHSPWRERKHLKVYSENRLYFPFPVVAFKGVVQPCMVDLSVYD